MPKAHPERAGDCQGVTAKILAEVGLSPRREARNPPRYFSAIGLVLPSERCPQRRLFVEQHEQVSGQPDDRAIFKQPEVSENQGLPEDRHHHSHVHWISYIPVEAAYYQVASWKYGRGRPQALKRESGKGIQETNGSQRDNPGPDETDKSQPEKRGFGPPMGDPPGHQTGKESRGDDQKDRRADDRPRSPHRAFIEPADLISLMIS
jgi:hypothetical protein